MNFKETLDACDAAGILVYTAKIAYEVEFFFPDKGRNHPDFEQMCQLVSEAYIDIDYPIDVSKVVETLKELLEDGEELDNINSSDIVDNIDF